MWTVHKNRVDRGKGGTYRTSGLHENMTQDRNYFINDMIVTTFALWTGTSENFHYDIPHMRWHKSFEDYPSHLVDIDDYEMHEIDMFERFKPLNTTHK